MAHSALNQDLEPVSSPYHSQDGASISDRDTTFSRAFIPFLAQSNLVTRPLTQV